MKIENGKTITDIVNTESRTYKRAVPTDLEDVPLLVLLLDQGSIGAAGTGFTDFLGKFILMKFEKIHRLIRDIKLALLHSCGGVLLKAQVFSSNLWNYHSKPFGSGHFGVVLQRALNVFSVRNTVDSPRFQKYLPRISKELDMQMTTREDQENIFKVCCDLPNIRQRLVVSKLGRWFSWNSACHENILYFSAFKMILEDHLAGSGVSRVVDPDDAAVAFDDIKAAVAAKTPYAQIQKLKEEGGGLHFAYKLSASSLHNLCTIVAEATRPCWDWYTLMTTTCKTPKHALKYNIEMAEKWSSDQHLKATFIHNLYNHDTLSKCDVGTGTTSAQKLVMHRLCEVSWNIVSERVGSLAARHSVPPDCYAAAVLDGKRPLIVFRMLLDRILFGIGIGLSEFTGCHDLLGIWIGIS